HRPQTRLKFRSRRAAVEHQTWSHQIAGVRWKTNYPCAVGYVDHWRNQAIHGKPCHEVLKSLELLAREFVIFVRHGQMRTDSGHAHTVEFADGPDDFERVVLPDADAAHTGIHREMNLQWFRARECRVSRRFLHRGHRWNEALHNHFGTFLSQGGSEEAHWMR